MRLHFETVVAGEKSAPTRVAWILHGILGSGRNWRSFARRLVNAHPDWKVVLPDHRNHGKTGPAPPPHRIADCVADLGTLPDPDLVIGHSFGGKVALAWAFERGTAPVWVLDSIPVSLPEPDDQDDIENVLSALSAVSLPAEDRTRARETLLARGLPVFQVDWLLTSMVRAPTGGWVWMYGLEGIAAMMADYFALDFGPALSQHLGNPFIHLVRAERSNRWTPAVLERLSLGPGVELQVLPDADHWLHVDNPEGLSRMLATAFD